MTQEKILERIIAERQRQIAKWGEQHHDPAVWLLIFTEELGEVAKSILEDDSGDIGELIQCAAVLMAWIEDHSNRKLLT